MVSSLLQVIDSFEADASCDATLQCELRKALKNYQVRPTQNYAHKDYSHKTAKNYSHKTTKKELCKALKNYQVPLSLKCSPIP